MVEESKKKPKVIKITKGNSDWFEEGEMYDVPSTIAEEQVKKGFAEFVDKDKLSFSFKVSQLLLQSKKTEATEVLVNRIKQTFQIYTVRHDEKPEMWIYNKGIYVPQGQSYIKEFCRKVLELSYTTNLANQVIAKLETDTYIEQDEFFSDSNPHSICVENGILNLETKKLTIFNPKKIFFNKIPVVYDKDKKCPMIIKHFNTILKDKGDIPVIQELFGYLLYKEYFIEKAFMFCGDGRNGKGKTLDLMKRFLGANNCANIPIQQFENDNFALGELFNKMANLAGDISKTALKETGNFKSLTGRDLISAPRKFLTRVNFVNYAKMIFCANDLPITYDLTPAFWNRWILLDFPYEFVSEKEFNNKSDEDKANTKIADANIIDKLTTDEELSGLLNWALKGINNLIEKQDFSYSKSVEDVKNLWIRKSSSFNAFLMDCIVEDFDSKIEKKELRKCYSIYCKKYKLKMIGEKIMKAILEKTFGIWDERPMINSIQFQCWNGIKFSKDSKDSNRFSIWVNLGKSGIGVNTPSNHTNLTNKPKIHKTEFVK